MELNVTSEIGRLEKVLIHLPGREIDDMLPSMMEELLFDDILFGDLAREEHERFQKVLRMSGAETLDLRDLFVETLESPAGEEVVRDLIERLRDTAPVIETIRDKQPREIAEMVIGGVVEGRHEREPSYALTPVPNLFFTRDPQVVIGDGVAISSMATDARRRESLISWYVFRHHPAFDGTDVLLNEPSSTSLSAGRPSTIEGGDVLIPREDMLLIGLSERTTRAGIEELAASLRDSESKIRTIFVVEVPPKRSYMHLDTVFTITSHDECLAFPPVILDGGELGATVYEIDLDARNVSYTLRGSLLDALASKGLDLEPIPCGGSKRIDQDREQWTDGANAFALSPGVILIYERNRRTAEELDKRGYAVVEEADLMEGRVEIDLSADRKYAIMIEGHELSRARGGPRCMTMPLRRAPLD